MDKREISELARRPNVRVSITLPLALVDAIDAEAERIGVGRSALVEYWLLRQLAGPAAEHPVRPRPADETARAK